MTKDRQMCVISELLDRHGSTFCEESGIHLKNTPAPLFQLLVLSLLCSARISADQAVRATKALFDSGLTTPEKMAEATWSDRVKILNENGYARYDESTSRMLQETSDVVIEQYDGDLRKLRQAADHNPEKEHKLITEFKGIGPTGADIFLREVQAVWDEVYPFFDKLSLKGAVQIGLPSATEDLSELVQGSSKAATLAVALVRMTLAKDSEQILRSV